MQSLNGLRFRGHGLAADALDEATGGILAGGFFIRLDPAIAFGQSLGAHRPHLRAQDARSTRNLARRRSKAGFANLHSDPYNVCSDRRQTSLDGGKSSWPSD